MAIEKDLKRIADSLEKLAEHFTADKTADVPVVTEAAPAAPTAAPAAPTAAPAAPTAAPAAPTAAPTAMTPEQLNAMLVAEFKRIGDRAPIDAAMKELGVTSVAGLTDPTQQQALVAKVQSIPSAAA